MKRLFNQWRILLLVGGVLFLAGEALLAASFLQGAQGDVLTIPGEAGWFYRYEIKVLGASRLAGEFAATAGVVNVYVFEEVQYDLYDDGGGGESLYSISAPSGSFVADLPATGTYYLVLAHGSGSEDSVQDVRVSFRVAGMHPDLIVAGGGLIAAGIAGVGVGLRQRERRVGAGTPV